MISNKVGTITNQNGGSISNKNGRYTSKNGDDNYISLSQLLHPPIAGLLSMTMPTWVLTWNPEMVAVGWFGWCI